MFRTVFRGLAAAAIFLVFLACDGPLSGYYTKDAPPGEEERVLFCGFVYYEDESIFEKEEEGEEEEGEEEVGEEEVGEEVGEAPVKKRVLAKIPVKGGISVYVVGITASYAHLIDDRGEFSFYVPTKDAAGKEISQYTVVFTDIAPREDENGHRYRYVQTTETTYELAQIEKSSEDRIKIKLETKSE